MYQKLRKIAAKLLQNNLQFEVIKWLVEWQRKGLTKPGDYLEFGCGLSTIYFYKALMKFYNNSLPEEHFHMWLFDSFKGLPEPKHLADQHILWGAGTFDLGGVENFKKILINKKIPRKCFTIIEGYFENTLKKFDKRLIKKASFIYMDCDYYTSTKIALNFCKDFMQNFTVIYFDDLYSFAGNPNRGQLLAISEFNRENKNVGLVHCPVLDYVASGKLWWSWVS